jgi:carboxyl-terminal processing protease
VTSFRLTALALLCAAALPAGGQNPSPTRPRSLAEDLQLFSQVLNQIRVNHPDSVDTHALLMAAIEGMVQAADPHSFVIPAVRFEPQRYQEWLDGKLYPVQVSFAYVYGAPLVAAVTPGTRAARQDILVGDELIEIDGKPVQARSAQELSYTLAGAKGSSVNLKFERRRADGSVVQVERVVPRERSDEGTDVPVAMMLDSATGYVRVTTFEGARVADDLKDRIGKLEHAGMQRLVLDLRDNGGGRVDQASDIAGAFLPSGTLVYTISSPKRDLIDTGRVKRWWGSERKYPLNVMVNRGTASASELLAGALQDHDRATIVGHISFGKALVMMPVFLSDGSYMLLVVGRVSTPCGRVIQRDYRGLTAHHYFRLAGTVMDTVGRPTCKSDNGRILYGGGGIVPDVLLPDRNRPAWQSRLDETDVLLAWSGGYQSAHAAQLTDLNVYSQTQLPAEAVADLRTFAATRGVEIPTDSASTAILETVARRSVAYAKWGEAGFYAVLARTDPEVAAAAKSFPSR